MRVVFWCSLLLIAYAYAGYAVLLRIRAMAGERPVRQAPVEPTVSVIMAAHNEQANLPQKLENLREMEYPAEKLQIIVASDGSTDGTAEILRGEGEWITAVVLPEARGKAVALNAAVERAAGDVLVFLDVRQRVDARAVAELVSCFADPEVGAVSGELLLESEDGAPAGDALGIYWKIEKLVRKLESATGSVVGVTGAIYAMRRELYVPLPPGTILDDVMVPMQVARAGKRIVFLPSAVARDRIFSQPGKEFGRKVRTLMGNYQMLRLAPWMLSGENPLLFRLVSHKLMRLAVPLLLVLLLLSSALAPGGVYKLALGLQLVVYGLSALGAWKPGSRKARPVAIAHTFVMLNLAAAKALYFFVSGRTKVWV